MSSFRKVQPGDPLVIPASTFNTLLDVAQERQNRQHDQRGPGAETIRQTDIVLVRNDSGQDVERFGVLGIDEPVITPDENEDAFQNQWALACSTPDQALHKGRFVITLEPIADTRFGRAVLAGICAVKVDADTDDRTFADISDGEIGHLVAGDSGAAQILWRKTGTGPQWAVVRLGNLGSAVAFPLAKITGRAGTSAPWLYTGVQVEHNGGSTFDPGDFTEIAGGPDLAWKLINLMEIGAGGAGVNPQEDGSIVMYWPMGDRYAFVATHYKGTYP